MSEDVLDDPPPQIEIKIEEEDDDQLSSPSESTQYDVDVTFPVIDATEKSDSVQTVTRKRGRPPRHCEYEWSEKDTYRLIELWSKEKLLYNTSDVFYMHRDFRAQSLNNICKTLRDEGIELCSPGDVRNKMNNLRNYYSAEKRKEKKSLDSELPFKSNWKFYDELCFLDENYKPRANSTSIERTDDEFEESVFLDSNTEAPPTMISRSIDPPSTRLVETSSRLIETSSRLAETSKQGSVGAKRKPSPPSPPEDSSPSAKRSVSEPSTTTASSEPASSFMTVFRKSRKHSKVMYSMNESANFVVETRPVFENTSKSFRMSKRVSFPKENEPIPPAQCCDEVNVGKRTLQQGVAYPKELTLVPVSVELPSIGVASTSSSSAGIQNLDKCYADLIYQLLVSMPDSVEKAMLKLEFQQKLINLKYSQSGKFPPQKP